MSERADDLADKFIQRVKEAQGEPPKEEKNPQGDVDPQGDLARGRREKFQKAQGIKPSDEFDEFDKDPSKKPPNG